MDKLKQRINKMEVDLKQYRPTCIYRGRLLDRFTVANGTYCNNNVSCLYKGSRDNINFTCGVTDGMYREFTEYLKK